MALSTYLRKTVTRNWITLTYVSLALALVVLLGYHSFVVAPEQPRQFNILAVNDIYRIDALDGAAVAGMPRLRALRRELEARYPHLLFLHAGDFLFPSFMSKTESDRYLGTAGEHMIQAMNRLDGRAQAYDPYLVTVFGNHEFDNTRRKDPNHEAWLDRLYQRIESADFRWLHTNIDLNDGLAPLSRKARDNLHRDLFLTLGGVRVGLFGLTMQETQPYNGRIRSPLPIAAEKVQALRQRGAEFVIALTHLDIQDDLAILGLGENSPDLIIGGHEHEAMACDVHGRYVLKADADARSYNLVQVTVQVDGSNTVEPKNIPLTGAEDPALAAWVARTRQQFEDRWCQDEGAGCLSETIAHAPTDIDATESSMRSRSMPIGNWVADVARSSGQALLAEADDLKAPFVAVINSGGFRLNQNIQAQAPVTNWHAHELLPYETLLVAAKVTGAELADMMRRAYEKWPGNGSWLQISGFQARYTTQGGTAHVTLTLDQGGASPGVEITKGTQLTLITSAYIASGGDDYAPLSTSYPLLASTGNSATQIDLRQLVMQEMKGPSFQNMATDVRIHTPARKAEHCKIIET